jgi:hypothetical protein
MRLDRLKKLNLCFNRHRNVSPLRTTSLLRLRAALVRENYAELLAMRATQQIWRMPPEAIEKAVGGFPPARLC